MTYSVPLQQIPFPRPPDRARIPPDVNASEDRDLRLSKTSYRPNMSLPVAAQAPNSVPSGLGFEQFSPYQTPNTGPNNTWNTMESTATAFSEVPLKDADYDPRR